MLEELTDKSYEMAPDRLYIPYHDLIPHRYNWDKETETYLPSWKKPLPEDLRLRPGIHEGYRFLLKTRELYRLLRKRRPMNEIEHFISRIEQREIDSLFWLFEQRARPQSYAPEIFTWPLDIRFSESLAMGTVLGWEAIDVAPEGAAPGKKATFDEFLLWSSSTGTDFDPVVWRHLYNSAESSGAFMSSEPLWVSTDSDQYPRYIAFLQDFSEKNYCHGDNGLTVWKYMRIMRDRFFIDTYRSLLDLDQLRRRGFVRLSGSVIESSIECESDVGGVLASYATALEKEATPCGWPTSIVKDVANALLDTEFSPVCPECGYPLRGHERRVECTGCYRQCLFPRSSYRTDPFWYACAAVEGHTLIYTSHSGRRLPVKMVQGEKEWIMICKYMYS